MSIPDFAEPTHIKFVRSGKEHILFSPSPTIYLLGIGAVLDQWSQFEQWLDNSLQIWRWNKQAEQLSEVLPYSFMKRAKLLKASVRVAVPSCPTICRQVSQIADDALVIAKKRNLVTHSHWFPYSASEMVIHPSIDGTKQRYQVEQTDLLFLATTIKELCDRLVRVHSCYVGDEDEAVPFAERRALQTHYENNRPNSPIPEPPAQPPLPFMA